MRKLLLSVLTVLTALFCMTTPVKAISNVNYYNSPVYNSVFSDPQRTFSITYKTDVSKERKNQINNLLNKVPDIIKYDVVQNGFVYIVDGSGAATQNHAGLTGIPEGILFDGTVVDYGNGIQDQAGFTAINSATAGKTQMAVIHELGHAVNFIIANNWGYKDLNYAASLAADPTWQSIYIEEQAKSGFASYNRTNATEYFGEVFRWIFEDETKLDKCPKSRDYIKNVLNQYYGLEL